MKETIMHMLTIRRHIGTLAAVLAVAGLLLTPASDATARQEAIVTGAWMETLGVTAGADGESLVLARLTLEPGATLRGHDHPGAAVLSVESGVLETELIRGSGAVERSDNTVEIVSADAIVTLHAGDSIAYEQDCGKRMTNAGDEPLVMILSLVADDGQPLFSFDAPPPSRNPSLQ
jgi:quercetin dioxygenase-like cupin family protein